MELRVLQYFLTVAREETITKAADALHITQPTLSRQLSQLEEELGVVLFSRGKRKITLTEEGILLQQRAKEITELIEKTERELTEQDSLINGTITFGCGIFKSCEYFVQLIQSFRTVYPHVIFDFYTANADVVEKRMEQGLTDIGLLMEPIDVELFNYIRMPEADRWVVFMRRDDPLAAKANICVDDLIGPIPLAVPRRLKVQGELMNWFGNKINEMNIVFTNNFQMISMIMVKRHMCRSISIEGAVPYLDNQLFCSRPLSPMLEQRSVLAWKRRQKFSITTKKFIDFVQNCTANDKER